MKTGYNAIKLTDPRLGRNVSPDDEHLVKYPLRAAAPGYKCAPVIIGVNWYSNFYFPVQKDGKFWVGLEPNNLGPLQGGHCVVMPQDPRKDSKAWYTFYDQLREGACVGAGTSRAMSHLNRKRYKFRWLWEEAKEIDEWDDTNRGDNEGTSVRAALDILRTKGHVTTRRKKDNPSIEEGIVANRWALNVDEIYQTLGNEEYKQLGAIPFLNSWGKDYPHTVWMPEETVNRLIREDGEFGVIMDYEKAA